MFTVYVSSTLFALFVVCIILVQSDNKLSALGSALYPAAIATIFGAFIGYIIAGSLGHYLPMKDDVSTRKLVSVRGSDGYAGSFIFGFGGFGETSEYHVYAKNIDGSITPYTVTADDTTSIFEDPRLKNEGTWEVKRRVVDQSSALARWAISFDWDPGRNSFRVPVGTVVQTFKIQ